VKHPAGLGLAPNVCLCHIVEPSGEGEGRGRGSGLRHFPLAGGIRPEESVNGDLTTDDIPVFGAAANPAAQRPYT
jgi:hypothetical protein